MNKIETYLKVIAAVIAILVPALLLSGFAYHLGYIFVYDLSPDLVSKSLSDMLAESWYVSVLAAGWLIGQWKYLIAAFIVFIVYVVAVFFFLRHAKRKGVKWLFEEVTQEDQGPMFLGITQWQWKCFGDLIGYTVNWVFMPFWAIAIILLLVTAPFLYGKNYAEEQKLSFEEGGCNSQETKVSCITLFDMEKDGSEPLAEGILLTANKNRIAIYNKQLEIWPRLDNYLMVKKKKVAEQKKPLPDE